MKMKLAISAALSHDAKLLIFDEATAGLDPVVRDDILDILNDFTRNENHFALMTSHITSDLEKICDYIAFIHDGRLIACEEKYVLSDRISQAMPYSKRSLVASKYIVYAIFAVSYFVIYSVLLSLFSLMKISPNADLGYEFKTAFFILSVSTLIPAVGLPPAFKLGAEKSIYYIIFLCFAAGFAVAAVTFNQSNRNILNSACYILLPVCVLLFFCSYAVSLAIYRKKEF